MLDKLRELICNFVDINPDEINENSKLLGDLGLSSLDLVMVASEVEKEFNLELPEKLYESIKTVGDLIEYIEKNSK